jgi:hypothetical protein
MYIPYVLRACELILRIRVFILGLWCAYNSVHDAILLLVVYTMSPLSDLSDQILNLRPLPNLEQKI